MTSPDQSSAAEVRIGIFGGTFDPPHLGHLILAEEASHQLQLSRLLWVLTPDPPHKAEQEISPAERRERLTQAAVAGNPDFELSRVDLDRPAPHYAVDTLTKLRQSFPDATLVYLMGADSLADLPKWHEPEAFIALCSEIGVMARPGVRPELHHLARLFPALDAKLRWMKVPLLEIQAREIRARIRDSGAHRYYLPEAVYELIQSEGWYA